MPCLSTRAWLIDYDSDSMYVLPILFSSPRWYCGDINCTGICIVKYRKVLRSVTFILSAIFLALVREKGDERPQNLAQVAVCRRSDHHRVFIGCQNQRYPHYCLGQGPGATLSLKTRPYRLQRVQFVASRLTIFAALPRTMDRSNAKLGEGIKHLF